MTVSGPPTTDNLFVLSFSSRRAGGGGEATRRLTRFQFPRLRVLAVNHAAIDRRRLAVRELPRDAATMDFTRIATWKLERSRGLAQYRKRLRLDASKRRSRAIERRDRHALRPLLASALDSVSPTESVYYRERSWRRELPYEAKTRG